MKTHKEFHDYILHEVLADIPGIRSKAMFGGYGIYKDAVFFALIADDQLYFKGDEASKADYLVHGSEPFVYKNPKGKNMIMKYWLVPDEVMEDSHVLKNWVERAVAIARRAKKKGR